MAHHIILIIRNPQKKYWQVFRPLYYVFQIRPYHGILGDFRQDVRLGFRASTCKFMGSYKWVISKVTIRKSPNKG